MPWDTSDRADRLPPNWKDLVRQVWSRDGGRCTWKLPSGARCPRKGADVDHRNNNDDHSLRNLRLLCRHHHDKKTQREAWAGKMRRKSTKRPPEAPPGAIRR
jgi:5-methylcytosine-specific restriction endonuclease McrA